MGIGEHVGLQDGHLGIAVSHLQDVGGRGTGGSHIQLAGGQQGVEGGLHHAAVGVIGAGGAAGRQGDGLAGAAGRRGGGGSSAGRSGRSRSGTGIAGLIGIAAAGQRQGQRQRQDESKCFLHILFPPFQALLGLPPEGCGRPICRVIILHFAYNCKSLFLFSVILHNFLHFCSFFLCFSLFSFGFPHFSFFSI